MMSLKKPTNKFIIAGYSSRTHLLLDLDHTTLSKVKLLVKLIMREFPKVGDALIILSSKHNPLYKWIYTPNTTPKQTYIGNCYHVVFDNQIGYNSCDYILRLLTDLGIFTKIADKLRGLRRTMTLRISPKIKRIGIDPCPKPISIIKNEHTSRHDYMIAEYLACLKVAYGYFRQ